MGVNLSVHHSQTNQFLISAFYTVGLTFYGVLTFDETVFSVYKAVIGGCLRPHYKTIKILIRKHPALLINLLRQIDN